MPWNARPAPAPSLVYEIATASSLLAARSRSSPLAEERHDAGAERKASDAEPETGPRARVVELVEDELVRLRARGGRASVHAHEGETYSRGTHDELDGGCVEEDAARGRVEDARDDRGGAARHTLRTGRAKSARRTCGETARARRTHDALTQAEADGHADGCAARVQERAEPRQERVLLAEVVELEEGETSAETEALEHLCGRAWSSSESATAREGREEAGGRTVEDDDDEQGRDLVVARCREREANDHAV